MCEKKTNTFTKEQFEEVYGSDADAYCVYYLDDDGVMHFAADYYDLDEGAFTTDFNNATAFGATGVRLAMLLGSILLDYDLHIVHISTKVKWDC